MTTYAIKNAIVDLGFIDGCLQEHLQDGSGTAKYLWEALDRIGQRITMDDLASMHMIYDLGIIRGAMWLKPLPGAYSDAMDRLMELFVEGKVDWYQLPQPFTGREHEDPVLSDELRDEIYGDYACEGRKYAAETAKLAGFEGEFIIDRIVPPRCRPTDQQKSAQEKKDAGEVAAASAESDLAETAPPEPALALPVSAPKPPAAAFNPFNPSGKRGRREWTPEQRAAQAERAKNRPPLVPDSALEAVKADFEEGASLDAIGKKYGCSGSHIRNFLKKHGIDPRRTVMGPKKGGRPPFAEAEIQIIIDEKAKGTPSAEIGTMILRSPHVVDQKYSELKKAGRVPEEHLTPEALGEKKALQNQLVSARMKAYHALGDSEWPDIEEMLTRQRRSVSQIASDYDVTFDVMRAFVDRHQQADEPSEATASRDSPPGEAFAPFH